jgi:hypothetical protein
MIRSTFKNHPRAAAVLVVASMLVGGCTSAVTLRNDMQNSKIAYKSCLESNPGNSKACETQRLMFQADVDAYSSIGKTPN